MWLVSKSTSLSLSAAVSCSVFVAASRAWFFSPNLFSDNCTTSVAKHTKPELLRTVGSISAWWGQNLVCVHAVGINFEFFDKFFLKNKNRCGCIECIRVPGNPMLPYTLDCGWDVYSVHLISFPILSFSWFAEWSPYESATSSFLSFVHSSVYGSSACSLSHEKVSVSVFLRGRNQVPTSFTNTAEWFVQLWKHLCAKFQC